MKDTWGDVDTGEASLQESEHHTKKRRTHTRIDRHQNEHEPRRSCEMNTPTGWDAGTTRLTPAPWDMGVLSMWAGVILSTMWCGGHTVVQMPSL